ncbi:aminopeptidase N-like isoform X2 [Pseudomyrmex gracilis]|uniref:aminopeptidase N-like isoform X2 n=1 Tax=Pseudomyrmex gracilis TaxID=219809 RepID=UPI000994BBCB|nr:aminopeptidase N-like isoform X2 [Pseudomyrmex gracilis]
MMHITQMLPFCGTLWLIFLTGIAFSTDETLSEEVQCIKPISYEMKIFPLIQNNSLNVETRVKINVSCVQSPIKLNFGRYCDAPKINFFSNNILRRDNLTFVFWPTSVSFFTKDQSNILLIRVFQVNRILWNLPARITYLQPGIYWINAVYHCILDKVATVSSHEQKSEETKYLILTRIPAEWIFPYWKNPAIKATFSIRIYHNNDEIALSHMPGNRSLEGNMSCTYFPSTPTVMSTHLVAVVVVSSEDYYFSSKPHVKSSLIYAISVIENMGYHMKNKWGDVLWSRMFYEILPINSSHYETLITTNLILFNEADITYDKELDSLTRRKEVTCLIARNVIQEMFNAWLLTLKHSDSWFIEGFSTFYGIYIIDQILHTLPYSNTLLTYKKINAISLLNLMVVQTRREILDFTEAGITYDFPVVENSFTSPSSIFIKLWRKHAISIFYMITDNHILYNSMFEEIITFYHTTTSSDTYNIQSNVDTLWRKLLSEMLIHRNKWLINILTTVITSWIHVGYPIVQVNRHNNTRTLEILIKDCFLSNKEKSCVSTWWIPVTYITIPQCNTKYQSYLQPNENNIIVPNIEEDDSIIFIDVPGYRVNYDRKSWKIIALFLKRKTSKILSDVSLAQILDDAFYFLVQNPDYNENSVLNIYENLDIFFDIANSVFHVKNSYIAWYPIFTAFEYLSKIFPFPESAYIKEQILDVVNKFLEASSHTPSSENNVNNQLYYEVLKWACILDSIKCKDIIMAELKWHILNPARNRFLQSWQKWIFCQSLIVENSTYETSFTWYTLKTMYETQSKVEEMFKFLPCSRLRRNIFSSFKFFATTFLPSYERRVDLKKSDRVSFLFNIYARHSKTLASLTSVLEHIRYIKSDINISALMNCIINNIYSDEGLSMVTDEKFLQMLKDRHRAQSYVIFAVKYKVDDRRALLVKIKNNFFTSRKMHLFTGI